MKNREFFYFLGQRVTILAGKPNKNSTTCDPGKFRMRDIVV